MSDIVAVLVVPAEGDPGGLLAEGPLACIPPQAMFEPHGGRDGGTWVPWQQAFARDRPALALWWDGALVPEGWDRAIRVLWHTPSPLLYTPVVGPHNSLDATLDHCISMAVDLVSLRCASRVVRLARVDGRLVEVQS